MSDEKPSCREAESLHAACIKYKRERHSFLNQLWKIVWEDAASLQGHCPKKEMPEHGLLFYCFCNSARFSNLTYGKSRRLPKLRDANQHSPSSTSFSICVLCVTRSSSQQGHKGGLLNSTSTVSNNYSFNYLEETSLPRFLFAVIVPNIAHLILSAYLVLRTSYENRYSRLYVHEQEEKADVTRSKYASSQRKRLHLSVLFTIFARKRSAGTQNTHLTIIIASLCRTAKKNALEGW